MKRHSKINVRTLTESDCKMIAKAFAEQEWHKPVAQYERYNAEQRERSRDVLVAEYDRAFAGYLTIKWESHYKHFRTKDIPEIADLNVLIKFRNKGIATALMDEAECRIGERSNTIGIGVGLTADYGAAQRFYVKRGYVPDGLGISQDGVMLKHGDEVTIDDAMALYFTKSKETGQ